MRIRLILALAFLLIFTASAKEELVEVGSYKVSFNMDTSSSYKLNMTPPGEDDIFKAGISGKNDFAYISAGPVKSDTDTSSEKSKSIVEYMFDDLPADLKPNEVQYYKREIDGQQAVLGVGVYSNFRMFYASYFKEVPESGYVMVIIESLYPWNDGTESLLNSLKVEYTPTEQYGTSIDTSGQYGTPYETSSENNNEAYGTYFSQQRSLEGPYLSAKLRPQI